MKTSWLLLAALAVCGTTSPVQAGDNQAGDNPADWQHRVETGAAVTESMRPASETDPDANHDTDHALAQWQQARTHALQLHVRELQVSPQARDRLVAALLASAAAGNGARVRPTTTPAFAAARRMAPQDHLVAWLGALECPAGETVRCNADDALARLQSIEADNAAVWVMAAMRAQQDGQPERASAHLQRAARASHYDVPTAEIGGLLYRSLQQVPSPPLTAPLAAAMAGNLGIEGPATERSVAAVEALGVAHAVAIPGYSGLSELCPAADAAPVAANTRSCRAVLELLADADTALTRLIGLKQLIRMAPGHADSAAWREDLRELRWWMTAHAGPLPAWYPDTLFEEGEIAAMQAVLRSRGQSPAPPAGWLPDDVRGRALITGDMTGDITSVNPSG